jgi:hypothetical protein
LTPPRFRHVAGVPNIASALRARLCLFLVLWLFPSLISARPLEPSLYCNHLGVIICPPLHQLLTDCKSTAAAVALGKLRKKRLFPERLKESSAEEIARIAPEAGKVGGCARTAPRSNRWFVVVAGANFSKRAAGVPRIRTR